MHEVVLDPIQEKALALAGVFQACEQVQQVARHGRFDESIAATALNSILNTEPGSTVDVYGDIGKVTRGLQLIQLQLSNEVQQRDLEITRYTINALYLGSKLLKDEKMLSTVSQGIERAKGQAEHFELLHPTVFASLGELYAQTISNMHPRIMVAGEPLQLNNPDNQSRIRALLLAAVRSGVLWRQLGGSRWQILFKRKKLLEAAKSLLTPTFS